MMTGKRRAAGIASRKKALAGLLTVVWAVLAAPAAAAEPAGDLAAELKAYPYRIVYETYQDDNWELHVSSADGSEKVNLTQTPQVNELYPHASPDGSKIAFVVDEGEGQAKVRSVYVMNRDGTGRKLVAANARDLCWNGDGTKLAYLGGESDQFTYTDYATKGLFVYDLATGQRRQHPNKGLYHLYNPCWAPDGEWFISTVHAGMDYRHAILAIEADGMGVYNLEIPGCRPDISPDGRKIAWGPGDFALRVGELDFSGPRPKVVNARDVIVSEKPMETYHVDWSPDGKYLAFSRGPAGKVMGRIPELVGVIARDWDICVADASQVNRFVQITADGKANKEPDWIPQRRVGQ